MNKAGQAICLFILFLLTPAFSTGMAAGSNAQSISPMLSATNHPLKNRNVLNPLSAIPVTTLPPPTNGKHAYHPNQVLVKFKKGTSDALIRARTRTDTRISKRKHFKTLSRHKGQDYYLLASETESAAALKKRLLSDPTVAAVTYNYAMTIDATVPSDPNFSMQWSLNNTGQTFMPNTAAGTPDADIDAPDAWDFEIGSDDVVIAVLDNGVDYDHPDLMDNIWTNAAEENGDPGVDDDENGYVDDIFGIDTGQADCDPMGVHWHGTHVAGTIAAVGDNGIGVTGINWHGKVLAVKLSAADGLIYTDSVIEAFEYLIDLKVRGINIVAANASFGGTQHDAVIEEGVAMLEAAGIILVASAGNDGVNTDLTPHYPSDYDLSNIISVAATDCDDALASFSNYGSISTDLGAPGVSALSTYVRFEYTPTNGDTFFDDMESGGALWSADAPWTIAQLTGETNSVWSDSPAGNYAANTYARLISKNMDLTAAESPAAPFKLGFLAKFELEEDDDFLNIFFYAPPRASLWQRTQAMANGGSWSWADSPEGSYPANAFSWLVSPPVDLSTAVSGATLSFSSTGILEAGDDQMRIYFSADGGASWTLVHALTGDYSDAWHEWSLDIPAAYYTAEFCFAFVLKTDNAENRDGYYLDDIAIQDDTHTIIDDNAFFWDGAETATPEWEHPQFAGWEYMGSLTGSSDGEWVDYNITIDDWLIWDQFRFAFVLDAGNNDLQMDGVYLDRIGVGIPAVSSHSYAYASGTSMAVPHVSGALALMAAHHPYESMTGRIYRIFAGTDPLPSLENKTTTGGRLNLLHSLRAIGLCEGEHLAGVADGDVDGVDLSVLAADFNTPECSDGTDCESDLDDNGITDAFDLGVFAADFGQTACP